LLPLEKKYFGRRYEFNRREYPETVSVHYRLRQDRPDIHGGRPGGFPDPTLLRVLNARAPCRQCLRRETYQARGAERYHFAMIRWLLRQNAIDVLFVVISTAVVLLFISMLPWPKWRAEEGQKKSPAKIFCGRLSFPSWRMLETIGDAAF
jgi:hypothetical protein